MKIQLEDQSAHHHKASEDINTETLGLAYGFLGALAFSLTLPATRLAISDLDATFVGLERTAVALIPTALAEPRSVSVQSLDNQVERADGC